MEELDSQKCDDRDRYMDLTERLMLEIISSADFPERAILMRAMLKYKRYPIINSKSWKSIKREGSRFMMSLDYADGSNLRRKHDMLARRFLKLKNDEEAMAFKLRWL